MFNKYDQHVLEVNHLAQRLYQSLYHCDKNILSYIENNARTLYVFTTCIGTFIQVLSESCASDPGNWQLYLCMGTSG